MTSTGMYTDIILDYYRHPRNFGTLRKPDISARDSNPLCGDVIDVQLQLKGGTVEKAVYSGHGCAISQAAAGMLIEQVEGMALTDVKNLTKEDMLAALGISISPARLKCALLALKVLKMGVYAHLGAALSEDS